MNGHVDEQLRALLSIRVSPIDAGDTHEFLAWIDTAFNGSLVLPQARIDEMQLAKESSAEAMLADGTTVELETYGCSIEWFGKRYDTQVITNDCEYGLIGTMLLAGHKLEIDYGKRTVSL